MTDHGNEMFEAIATQIEQLQGADVPDDVIEMVLSTITEGVVNCVPAANSAGITLVENGEVGTIAGTDETAGRLDELQSKHDAGPCLESAWEQHMIRIDDFGSDERWPLFVGDVIAQTPVRSSVSFQLYRDGTTMGALNVYSDRPHAFDTQAEQVGMAFATQAALALHSGARQRQFTQALASRDVLGQAKGILMERYDIDADEAFDLLRKLSQDTNTKAAVLARRLIDVDHPSTTTRAESDTTSPSER